MHEENKRLYRKNELLSSRFLPDERVQREGRYQDLGEQFGALWTGPAPEDLHHLSGGSVPLGQGRSAPGAMVGRPVITSTPAITLVEGEGHREDGHFRTGHFQGGRSPVVHFQDSRLSSAMVQSRVSGTGTHRGNVRPLGAGTGTATSSGGDVQPTGACQVDKAYAVGATTWPPRVSTSNQVGLEGGNYTDQDNVDIALGLSLLDQVRAGQIPSLPRGGGGR